MHLAYIHQSYIHVMDKRLHMYIYGRTKKPIYRTTNVCAYPCFVHIPVLDVI